MFFTIKIIFPIMKTDSMFHRLNSFGLFKVLVQGNFFYTSRIYSKVLNNVSLRPNVSTWFTNERKYGQNGRAKKHWEGFEVRIYPHWDASTFIPPSVAHYVIFASSFVLEG